MGRPKTRVKLPKRPKRKESMNINRFQEHDVDEILERKLDSLGREPWWRGFICHINSVYNEVSNSSTGNEFNVATDTAKSSPFPNRSLHWAITTSAHMLSTYELPKRLQVLSYVIDAEDGVQNLLFLLEETILSAPLSIQLSFVLREIVNARNRKFIAKVLVLYSQCFVEVDLDLQNKAAARAVAIEKIMEKDTLYRILNLLGALNNEIESNKDSDVILEHRMSTVNLVWVVASMAAKDSKFGVHVKGLGRVKFLHLIIRESLYNLGGEVHQPFLRILRIMCRSAPIGNILRGDKIFNTIKRLFDAYNYQPCLRFQLLLDILMILTKTATKPRLHSKKFLKSGLLISLMRAFNYWPMWKGKGLLKLSKTTLIVYSNLALTATGRRALLNTDALASVRRFCESCPNDKYFDDVVMRACAMVSLANGKHKLPFRELISPAKFEIPQFPGLDNSKESGTSSDEDDPDEPELPIASDDDQNSDNSDVEQEPDEDGKDDIDSDDSEEDYETKSTVPSRDTSSLKSDQSGYCAKLLTPRDSFVSCETGQSLETSIDKLAGFAHFFKELDGKLGDRGYISEETQKRGESILLDILAGKISLDGYGDLTNAAPRADLKYAWPAERPEYGNVSSQGSLRKVYLAISRRVRSVIPFAKIAYPDFALAYNGKRTEQLIPSADRHTLRNKVLMQMGRAAGAEIFKPRVVYDLDALLCPPPPDLTPSRRRLSNAQIVNVSNAKAPSPEELCNDDERHVGVFDKKRDFLYFESRFESGNLRKAIQVGEKEYDLYLMSDVNSTGHNQWFYFQISNIQDGLLYTFNIVNCVKCSSQFNFGMQPVVFSVSDAVEGRPGWIRAGSQVVYHKNGFRNETTKKSKAYHSASFSVMFHRRGDICYIAYHYPYTYSRLLTELWKIKEATNRKKVFVRYDVLCSSLNKNDVPLVTVTAPNDPFHPVELREVIVFTARVHPGEPNASWVMHGVLHKLLFGAKMEGILQRYVFKIVPMLNVEGVINGCHRCGLTNEDLNRRWKNPNPILHPSIYNTKALIEYSCRVRNKIPIMYCDLHGHSRRKNVFLYGCSKALSWYGLDRAKPEDQNILNAFPEAMARRSPYFALTYCSYDIRKPRESTARVALWREFGINRSYTLESSYCGCDRGPYKGVSLGINHLIEVGESLCESCEDFYAPPPAVSASLYTVPVGMTKSDSKVNLVNLEEASWNQAEKDSSSDSDSQEEWNETSLNPVIS